MNYMKQVAEMLGLEIGEEFEILERSLAERVEKVKCKITEIGLVSYIDEGNWMCDHMMLGQILAGDESVEVIKQPYVPKKGKEYWTFINDCWELASFRWRDCQSDFLRLRCGMVFRTKNEAIDARPRIYEDLTGKKWGD